MFKPRVTKKRAMVIALAVIMLAIIAGASWWLLRDKSTIRPITSDNPTIEELEGNFVITNEQKAEYTENKAQAALAANKLDEAEEYIKELINKYKYKKDDPRLMSLQASFYMKKGDFQQAQTLAQSLLQSETIKSDEFAVKNWNIFLVAAKENKSIYESTQPTGTLDEGER